MHIAHCYANEIDIKSEIRIFSNRFKKFAMTMAMTMTTDRFQVRFFRVRLST